MDNSKAVLTDKSLLSLQMIKRVGGGTEIKGIGKVILEFENGDETRRVPISNFDTLQAANIISFALGILEKSGIQ